MTRAEKHLLNNTLLELLLSAAALNTQDLELVSLSAGTVLVEPLTKNQYVYFPINAMVAYFHVLEDGSTVQVAAIGNEGCVGAGALIGGQSPLLRAAVLATGDAYRLRLNVVESAYFSSPASASIFLKYFLALLLQVGQLAACHRKHSVSEQVCRWLLQWSDRVGGDEIAVTQETAASMLGVRREGVTQVMASLREEKLIETARGSVRILNKPLLKKKSCECYDAIRKEYHRLFSQ